jgi:hypothetical protein
VAPTDYINMMLRGWYDEPLESIPIDEQLSPKEATRDFLEELTGEWFGKCSHLRKKLEREWESINEASTPGVNAEEVLKTIWDMELETGSNMPNSTKIIKKMGKKSSYKGSVSQVLNRLSVGGKDPSSEVIRTFETEEIVRHRGQGWELSGYGRLLLYHTFEKNQEPRWIQQTAIENPPPSHESGQNTGREYELLRQGVNHYYEN